MPEKNKSFEECTPCGVSVSAGVLIKNYCKKDCQEITDEFMKGNMSLRDLAKKLSTDNEVLSIFKDEGVDIDITLNKAVEVENKKPTT